MNRRVIKIKVDTDIDSLKRSILQKLNIVNQKRNSVTGFEEKLKSYIDRNKSIIIVFQYNWDEVEKDLKFKLSLTNKVTRPYPDNYKMDIPLNR
jgi:hypothetical protein